MTLERGRDWGGQGPLPRDGVICASDAEVRAVVEGARRRDAAIPPIGLVGGDLARALGAGTSPERLQDADAASVRVDVGAVLVDGRPSWFVAHLVAHSRSWSRALAVMNGEWYGTWRVAPRAHPGDGRLDVVEARLGWRDRLAARRRLPSGDHVPHPGIRIRATSETEIQLGSALAVELDGESVGRGTDLRIRTEPGALVVVVAAGARAPGGGERTG